MRPNEPPSGDDGFVSAEAREVARDDAASFMEAYRRIKDPRKRAYIRWVVIELSKERVEQE